MGYILSVKRDRKSVTQGEVVVELEGVEIIRFCDNIQIIKPGQCYYGEMIDSWASVKPDSAFALAAFSPPHGATRYLREIKNIMESLDVAKVAEKNELYKALDIVSKCGCIAEHEHDSIIVRFDVPYTGTEYGFTVYGNDISEILDGIKKESEDFNVNGYVFETAREMTMVNLCGEIDFTKLVDDGRYTKSKLCELALKLYEK